MKKYTTTNINEAAFYATKGFKFKSKSTGWTSGEFIFEIDKDFERYRKAFWSNSKTQVNLMQWLSIRNELKYSTRNDMEAQKSIVLEGFPQRGEMYYYKQSGKAMSAFFGLGSPIHQQRKDAGNVFKTREEAMRFSNK